MVVGAIACLAGATSVAAVDARLKVPGGMCSLWTVKQVSSAMKETMKVVRDDPDYCVWYSKKDHNGNISTASAGLWGGDPSSDEPFIDQSREGPRWVGEIQVAGVPVLKSKVERSGKNRDMSMDAFPDASTWMNFNAHSVIGANVETALKRLIEIGVDKLPVIAPSASPLASPGTGPGSPCDLWTTDEVSAALGGEPMAIDGSTRTAQSCGYRGKQGSFTNLMAALGSADPGGGSLVDVVHQSFPDAVDVVVAGVPAVRIPTVPFTGDAEGWTQSTLFVFPGPSTVLQLQANAPEGVDGDAALIALAELALAHLGVGTPPSGSPPSAAPSGSPPSPAPSGLPPSPAPSGAAGSTAP
jgi:hypothetical protein